MDDDHQSDSGAGEENSLSLHEIVAKNDAQHLTSKLSREADHIDLNEKNEKGETPLHVAAISNKGQSHFKVIEILLKYGADPNAENQDYSPPFWYLLQNHCNLEILKLFLKFKADFTFEDVFGTSLLVPATCNCNNIDVVKFLIEDIGLNVNSQDRYDGSTILHEVARFNQIDSHYEILKYLLEKGASPNNRNFDGTTPLYHLVQKGNWKVIKLFFNHNADIHALSVSNDSNILYGFDNYLSDAQVLDAFINAFGLDVNCLNMYKKTPLNFILRMNARVRQINVKVIKCFFKNGANINIPDNCGFTPLIYAVNRIEIHEKEWFLKNLDYFNFLIGQTDFSVVHNNIHILKYNNQNYEDNDFPEFLWKWILEHLAKLKFLSIPIHPIVLKYINERTDYKNYFQKCIKELSVMSNTKPPSSWITYFNLLLDSRRKLKNYTGNENLIQDYKNNDWIKMFPIYGTLLKKNVEKGIRRRKLFDRSSVLLSDCLPIFSSTHLIVKDIFDCVLSKKDLSKFCELSI